MARLHLVAIGGKATLGGTGGFSHRGEKPRASRDVVRWMRPHSPLYMAWKEGTRLQGMAIKQTTPTAAAYVHITQPVYKEINLNQVSTGK